MKKTTREKKFKCPYNETLDIIKENDGHNTMTCYYFSTTKEVNNGIYE